MEIYKLLDFERLPHGISMVPIILYFPLGLALATIRFFISIHALIVSLLLPKTWVLRSVILRFMFGVTGIIISTDGDENRDVHARVLVCDHITPLDHLITSLVIPHICLLDWSLSPVLQRITGGREISPDKNKEEVVKFAKSLYNEASLPLLFFPEKTTTSGKIGLLKFWSLPFELGQLIQPVTIQVKRIDIFKINVSTAKSEWWSDFFWCLFVPYTIFKLRYLPVTEKKESESCDEFKERVRHNMCKSLGLEATSYTHSDKTEYLKRRPVPSSPTPVPNNVAVTASATTATPSPPPPAAQPIKRTVTSTTNQISASPEVKAMAEQVKNVLPHVPIATILAEVEQSRDVDVTISNILEGNVEFTPEEVTPTVNSVSPTVNETPCRKMLISPPRKMYKKIDLKPLQASQLTFKASSFGNNSGNRQMSLEERKQAMYDLARKKYKEKHNMS